MSRRYSPDGRFFLEAWRRDEDSYLSSESSLHWTVGWTATGLELASFGGRWDQSAAGEMRSGVSSVSFSDSNTLLVEHADGTKEERPLPPLSEAEERETRRRFAEWDSLWVPPAASAPLDWGPPVELFGRPIKLQMQLSMDFCEPGGRPASGSHVTLFVADKQLVLPPGREVRDCAGLRIGVRPLPKARLEVGALELSPRRP